MTPRTRDYVRRYIDHWWSGAPDAVWATAQVTPGKPAKGGGYNVHGEIWISIPVFSAGSKV